MRDPRESELDAEKIETPSVVSSNTFQIVAFNSHFSLAFGYPTKGKAHLLDFVAPIDHSLLLNTHSSWFGQEKTPNRSIECSMVLKAGIKVRCELVALPAPDGRDSEHNALVVIKPAQDMKGISSGSILHHIKEIYFKIGCNGRILETNASVLQTLNFRSLEDVVGNNIFEALHIEGPQLDSTELWKTMVAQGGEVKDYPLSFSRPDSTKVFLEISAKFFYNDQFKIEGIEGFAVDVTKTRQLIQDLETTLMFTRSLLHALPTPLMFKNQDLIFEGCNRAFSEITGVSQQELKGKRAGDIWEPEFVSLSEQKENEALKTGQYQVFEGYINSATGERLVVLMVTARHSGPDGKPVGVISSFLDITARKAIELAIKRNEEAVYKENLSLKRIINPHLKKTVMVGASPAVIALYDQIHQASRTNLPVLIEGESGTGKELVAQEIHRLSERSKANIVAVNCGAIPRDLSESTFFGHIKGAFTGAFSDNKGHIQSAHAGTLFLDEVNSIPLDKQAKLLRALESGEVTPVGGNTPVQSNFRLISASNQDLAAMVERGEMRTDFYYRLKVLSIKVPSLRERKEDIPMLAYHFLNQYKLEHPGAYKSDRKFITKHLLQELKIYDFPGNIRELRNILFQYFATENLILTPPPPEKVSAEPRPIPAHGVSLEIGMEGSLKELMNDAERRLILQLLERFRYNRTQVAKHLKIGRKTLYNKMRTHGIDDSF